MSNQQPESIGRADYPQPWLTGLSFDTAGNIVLGIRDRAGDQFGRLSGRRPEQRPNAFNFFGITAGDTLRAFINTAGNLDAAQGNPALPLSGWTLEMPTAAARPASGRRAAEHRPGAGRRRVLLAGRTAPRRLANRPSAWRPNTTKSPPAACLQIPGTDTLISTAFDPVRQGRRGKHRRLPLVQQHRPGHDVQAVPDLLHSDLPRRANLR